MCCAEHALFLPRLCLCCTMRALNTETRASKPTNCYTSPSEKLEGKS